MIKLGTTDIKGIMLGDAEISKVYLGEDVVYQKEAPGEYVTDGLVFWLDGINKGASNGTWVEKIHGTVFSGNATPTNKGFNFSDGQRMSGSWVNGTSNDFTVEVCYYTTLTGRCFVWGVGSTGARTPLYMDEGGKITTIQNLNVFTRPSSFSSNKTVSVNQDRGVYSGVDMTKSSSVDYWDTSPNTSTVYIGKGNGGVALHYPLTGIVYAIRVYNRRLTADEMLNNQRLDNTRFGLKLSL